VVPDQPYYVLIEAMGHNREADEILFDTFLNGIYDERLIVEAVLASSGSQVADLWRVREGAEVIVRAFGSFVSADVSIDVRHVDAFIARTKALLGEVYPLVRTATFGHLGDSNIHLAIHVGPDTLAEEANVERRLFQAVGEFGGAITAEHGIGQLKRDFLPEHRSPAEIALMRRLRASLDPDGLLNRDVLLRR
jgi:FAD/FMN-containing dehydrogenase